MQEVTQFHSIQIRCMINQALSTSQKQESYLQKIYMQPAEESEQVNLQTVQGQAPIKISLGSKDLVKNNPGQKPVTMK